MKWLIAMLPLEAWLIKNERRHPTPTARAAMHRAMTYKSQAQLRAEDARSIILIERRQIRIFRCDEELAPPLPQNLKLLRRAR